MIEKYYIEIVKSKSVLELYEMLKRINKKTNPEHFDFVSEYLRSKTSENLDNIPNYDDISLEKLNDENEIIGIEEPVKKELIERGIKKAVAKKNKNPNIGQLASRSSRVFAHLLDFFVLLNVAGLLVVSFGIEVNLEKLNDTTYFFWAFITVHAIYFVLNGYFLYSNGQTLGKRAMKIKIVTITNNNPLLIVSYGLRFLLPIIISQIFIVGFLFSWIDIFSFFRKDRRCIHDLIAKTKVVWA